MLVIEPLPETFEIEESGATFVFKQPTDQDLVEYIQKTPNAVFRASKLKEKERKEFYDSNKEILDQWAQQQYALNSKAAFDALVSFSGVYKTETEEFSGDKSELWRSLPIEIKSKLINGYKDRLLGVEDQKKYSVGLGLSNTPDSLEPS